MSASDSADEARPVSPDSQCRICLGPLQIKCIADSNCFHKFCLSCLKRWSEVKAECPLCKRPFKKIIYNMKGTGEYDFHVVQPPPPSPELLSIPLQETIRRHSDVLMVLSFSTGSSGQRQNLPGGRVGMYFQYSDLPPGSRYVLTSGPPTQDRETVSYRRSLAFRQSVYGQRLWVHDISQSGQVTRECNPTYYRENPEQLSRLRPWLKRELAVFVPYGRQVVETTENVLELMTRHNINSREFRNAVAPIIGERFTHFLHELRCFAQSYYDMRGFDENGVYDIPRPVRGSGRAARMFPAPPSTNESDDDVVEVTSTAAQNEIVLSDSDSDIELIEQPLPEIVISSGDEARPPRRRSACVSNEVAEISPTASDQTNDFDPDFQPTPSTSSGSTSHPETRKHLSKRSKRSSKSATRRRRRDSSSSSDSSSSYHFKKEMIKRIDIDGRKIFQTAMATKSAARGASSSNLVAGSSRPVDSISKRTRSETSRRKRERHNSMSDSDSDGTSQKDSRVLKKLKRARGSRLNPRYVKSSESSAGSDEERPKVKHVTFR